MATISSVGRIAKPRDPFYEVGKQITELHQRHNVVVATAVAGDIYILAEGLSFADRVDSIRTGTAIGTLTAATDNDIGFYKRSPTGALVEIKTNSKAALVDGANYTAGVAIGTDMIGGLTDANSVKSIGELLDLGVDSEPVGGVILALTTNVAPTTNNRALDLIVKIEKATRN